MAFLFENPLSGLVNLIFPCGWEFDRINTFLPLFAIGLKLGLKMEMYKEKFDGFIYNDTMEGESLEFFSFSGKHASFWKTLGHRME